MKPGKRAARNLARQFVSGMLHEKRENPPIQFMIRHGLNESEEVEAAFIEEFKTLAWRAERMVPDSFRRADYETDQLPIPFPEDGSESETPA